MSFPATPTATSLATPAAPAVEIAGPKQHCVALDGIRGFAILAVMWHHFTVALPGNGPDDWLLRFSEFGAHGVDLFFVLSGYLITSQLLGPRLETARIGRFYLRRALRIVPLYYALLIGVYLILPFALRETGFANKLATQTNTGGNWPWYAGFVSNFRNAVDGKFTNPALDVSWSLAIEMQFYLVWPWLIRFCSRANLKRVIWAVIILSPLLRAVFWNSGTNWIQILVLPFLRADALLWGAMIAIWLDEMRNAKTQSALPTSSVETHAAVVALKRLKTAALCCAPLIALLLLGGYWDRQNAFTATFGYSLIALTGSALCGTVLTLPQRTGPRRFFELRGLVFLSTYAYGLYLVHIPIRAFLRDVVLKPVDFSNAPFPPLGEQVLFYVVAFVACLIPAVMCWHLWEKFFVHLGHRLTGARTRLSPTPSVS